MELMTPLVLLKRRQSSVQDLEHKSSPSPPASCGCLVWKRAPCNANFARVPIRDVLNHKLQVGRHNGHHLVEVSPNLLWASEHPHKHLTLDNTTKVDN